MSLQLTKKRAEVLRGCITKPIQFGEHTVDAKDIRFVKAGSAGTEEIEFPLLTRLLHQLQKTKEKMSSEIVKSFLELLRTLEQKWYDSIESWIKWTVRLDILQTKTHLARKYGYCQPIIKQSDKSFFEAKGIRHVLIEHLQQNEIYVSNNIHLGSPSVENDGILLFGTNAVGKTSLIRSIGICIIMAQAGLFVPCSYFEYQPYTAIFSRILGNDNLFKGLSTFAVEMSELRVILKSADQNSLVLGDELCSGTEMESALSLFSAGLIELSKKNATFLFATHFHEITNYEEIQQLTRLGLKHMAVHYDAATQSLVYDRLLKDGQGSRMYGLEVCRSLYMDPIFLEKAYELRNKYFPERRGELSHTTSVYNAKKIRGKCEICHKEISTETHHLAPQELANQYGFIEGFHKNHPGNLAAVCETCHLSIHKEDKRLTKKKTTKGYIVS
jgi:DNA mismatch repair protein MutS